MVATTTGEAGPDSRSVVRILDGIPGAFERALQSLAEGCEGRTIGLDEL